MTFTPTDTTDYMTVTATVQLTVNKTNSSHHLGDTCGDHLRHAAERNSTGCVFGWSGRHFRLHSGCRHRVGRWSANAVGGLHAYRYG